MEELKKLIEQALLSAMVYSPPEVTSWGVIEDEPGTYGVTLADDRMFFIEIKEA